MYKKGTGQCLGGRRRLAPCGHSCKHNYHNLRGPAWLNGVHQHLLMQPSPSTIQNFCTNCSPFAHHYNGAKTDTGATRISASINSKPLVITCRLNPTLHRPLALLYLDQYRDNIRYSGVHQLMQLRPGHPFRLPLLICVQKQAAAAVRLHALLTIQTVSLLVTGKARTQVANTHKFCFHPSTVPDQPGRLHEPGALPCSKKCTQALRGRPRYLGAILNSLFLAAGQERLSRRAAVCVALADTCLTAPARTTTAPRREIGERKEQQRDPARECAFKGGEPGLFKGMHRAVHAIAIKLI